MQLAAKDNAAICVKKGRKSLHTHNRQVPPMFGLAVLLYRSSRHVDGNIPMFEDDREVLRLGRVIIDMLQAVAIEESILSNGVDTGRYGYLFQTVALPKHSSPYDFQRGW